MTIDIIVWVITSYRVYFRGYFCPSLPPLRIGFPNICIGVPPFKFGIIHLLPLERNPEIYMYTAQFLDMVVVAR